MRNLYAELCKKMAMLEIVTLDRCPACRKSIQRGYIAGIDYAKVPYVSVLETRYPYNSIDWNADKFKKFRVLHDNPPKRLYEDGQRQLKFVNVLIPQNWSELFNSFRQLRNNLMHGAKFFHGNSMELQDRDGELIKAGLAFISFLETEFGLPLE